MSANDFSDVNLAQLTTLLRGTEYVPGMRALLHPTSRTPILRPLLIRPDQRGSVREAYRASWGAGPILQVVHSESIAGVVRAMHAHKRQTDAWHFTHGRAFVQTYDHLSGEHFAFEARPDLTIIIPPGVSHGFEALTDLTLTYYLTEEYDSSDEFGFDAYDPDFPGARLWSVKFGAIRSNRDLDAASLAEFKTAW